jgi:hypothetical protein
MSEFSPESGMDTDSEAGTPGERAAFDSDDVVTAAVQDDAPLPADLAPDAPPGLEVDAPEFLEP